MATIFLFLHLCQILIEMLFLHLSVSLLKPWSFLLLLWCKIFFHSSRCLQLFFPSFLSSPVNMCLIFSPSPSLHLSLLLFHLPPFFLSHRLPASPLLSGLNLHLPHWLLCLWLCSFFCLPVFLFRPEVNCCSISMQSHGAVALPSLIEPAAKFRLRWSSASFLSWKTDGCAEGKKTS